MQQQEDNEYSPVLAVIWNGEGEPKDCTRVEPCVIAGFESKSRYIWCFAVLDLLEQIGLPYTSKVQKDSTCRAAGALDATTPRLGWLNNSRGLRPVVGAGGQALDRFDPSIESADGRIYLDFLFSFGERASVPTGASFEGLMYAK